MKRFVLPAAFLLAAPSPGLQAADFRSVQEPVAVLYDAPSKAATPLFVVQRGYPLEVIVNLEGWVKVRDAAGALSWIEKKSLGERRTLLVTGASVEVRARPEDAAPVVFSAAQNVTLDLLEAAPGGWLRVRHADGATGYVRAAQVWGS